jgi:hypothetical protein
MTAEQLDFVSPEPEARRSADEGPARRRPRSRPSTAATPPRREQLDLFGEPVVPGPPARESPPPR